MSGGKVSVGRILSEDIILVSDKKIAILGLDNAGKSSILLAMKKKFDIPEAVRGLKPTIKVERTSFQFMDHIIYMNDFGGQKSYIDEYLSHKVRYLSGIDMFFYVIDVQDSPRFDESIKFFQELTDYFEEIQRFVPIMIIFHKCDPKIQTDPTIIKNLGILKHRLRPWQEKFPIRFFKTNIFDLRSVVQAFSLGIKSLYTQSEAIQKFVDDIVDKMENVMALMVFEQNGIELGSYFLENITIQMQKRILMLYEIAQRRIVNQNVNTHEFSDRLDPFTKISGVIQAFDIEGLQFYIMLALEEHDAEVVVDQFNFFEQFSRETYDILRSLLLDDLEDDKALNP